MSSLTHLEKRQLEGILEMGGGYVLDFSDRTFKDFFHDTAKVDISGPEYAKGSGSKANRLRSFWEKSSDPIVGKVLQELMGVWLHTHGQSESKEYTACKKIAERLTGKSAPKETTEEEFLQKDLGSLSFASLPIDAHFLPVLKSRFDEVLRNVNNECYLSAILLSGSILEGAFLATAQRNLQVFNQAKTSPKDKSGKVKKFPDWSLAEFIEVSYECGMLSIDVKKFSHVLRDFRNYIHPYEQMASGFSPDKHTAAICGQVLKAAIANLSGKR